MDKRVLQIAEYIKKAGGRLMLVGGCVRDKIMGLTPKDFDCEIYNLPADKLQAIVGKFGKVDAVGASFQVYKVGQDIDISLPRRERKTGIGHKGFTVEGDPNMSFKEACSRRDFTINAIMEDPLTGEIVDPFKGVEDIEKKILRAVSEVTFQEDSLRVLRLAQFASRFDFFITPHTKMLAQQADLSDLPKERIWMEMEKLLMKSPKPSIGIDWLYTLGIASKLFPSLHFSGFIRNVLDRVNNHTQDLSYEERLSVMLTIMLWGAQGVEQALNELGVTSVNGYNVRKVVLDIHNNIPFKKFDDYALHKLSQHIKMKLMSKIFYIWESHIADKFAEDIKRLGIEEKPVEPFVKGRDLISYGMKPSQEMGELLAELYDKQLQGWVLPAVFAYARGSLGISDVGEDYPVEGKYQHLR